MLYLVVLVGLSPTLFGCLVISPMMRGKAATYEWPQEIRKVEHSQGAQSLTIEYKAMRREQDNDDRGLRRELVLAGEPLGSVTIPIEEIPALYPGGGPSKRSKQHMASMIAFVRPDIRNNDRVHGEADATLWYLEDWDGLPAAMERLRKGQVVVLRLPSNGNGDTSEAPGMIVVFVPTGDGAVRAVPLPEREKCRGWYYATLPIWIVADLVSQPVIAITWIATKIMY